MTTTTPRICVVGSLNMDLVVQTPALPLPGQTLLGGPFATFPGGKGANQAVAAARAGARVVMVGCVGDDSYGPILRRGLDAEGIDTRYVTTRHDTASGVALIAVAPDGQNTIIVAPGANAALAVAGIDHAAEEIRSSDALLIQLEVPLPAIVRAAEIAREAGTIVVLNPAPAQPLPGDVLALADFVVPNETEAAALTGITPHDWTTAETAARALLGQRKGSTVITLGSRGALLLHGGTATRQPAFKVDAVDATAAGDAFLGAFAVALAEGRPPEEAVRWGAAAGALAAATVGAQPSLPRHEALASFLAAHHT